MDGVLIIDKPAGITSHDVVNRVRRALKTKRVGHTGTLDPFATGVLVLLVGKATRLAQFVDKVAKEYVAEIRFGFATDTGDLTGKRLSEETTVDFSAEGLESVLAKFCGEIEQLPPMYSAKKVAGKKLYEHARKGEEIEREPAKIKIDEIKIMETNLDSTEPSARIHVVCSAGTYIRTLAEDIGKALGTSAHLTELRRTAAGEFRLESAVPLEKLEEDTDPTKFLLPIETIVADLAKLELPNERISATLNGMLTRVDRNDLQNEEMVAMLDTDGNLIAVGFYDATESCIKPKIVLG
jgi:tRNA pseudouridine55 synthase